MSADKQVIGAVLGFPVYIAIFASYTLGCLVHAH